MFARFMSLFETSLATSGLSSTKPLQVIFRNKNTPNNSRLIDDWYAMKLPLLVVEPTHLKKHAPQNGSFPQIGVNMKSIWVATN